MKNTLRCIFVLSLCVFSFSAWADEDEVRLGGRDVVVWDGGTVLENGRPQKKPVLFFSHGFHGCATQSRYLMEAFAAAGYIVFAPNHADATCANGEARWTDRAEALFRKPENWSDTTFEDRAQDFRALIDAIKRAPDYKDRVDWNRQGLVGHSLGGYTVLAMGGAWESWKLPNVKAILALSPYVLPFTLQQTMKNLDAPVMFQGGTRDLGMTPSLHQTGGAYDQAPPPKYYVEFRDAGHLAWTDFHAQDKESIVVYSLAFLDRYLKGGAPSPVLSRQVGDATAFEKAEK